MSPGAFQCQPCAEIWCCSLRLIRVWTWGEGELLEVVGAGGTGGFEAWAGVLDETPGWWLIQAVK